MTAPGARTTRRYLAYTSTIDADITAAHPQLRDLLQSIDDDALAYVRGRTVQALDRTSGVAGKKWRLPFAPTCLASGHGLLCAGGQNAELAVRSLHVDDADWAEANFSTGDSVVNAIAVSPLPFASGSRARLYVSSNDHAVGVWDVIAPGEAPGSRANLLRADVLPATTAINAAALSPDGRLLVACGDAPEVYLFEVSGGGKHRHVKTLACSRDAAFSVAWNRAGRHFAVASQDGVVSVFDVRQCFGARSASASGRDGRIAHLLTLNAGAYLSAARVVRYSPGTTTELLAYSEQGGMAHVVEAQTYEPSQTQHLQLARHGGAGATRASLDARGPVTLLPPMSGSDADRHSWLAVDASRSLRMAALAPAPPAAEAGPSRRHARRLVDVERRGSYAPRLSAGAPPGIGPSTTSASVEDVAAAPELTGLAWSPDGEQLYVGTERAICVYARDAMAFGACPVSRIL